MAILLITHDLGVVAELADEVVVMYAGKVVESAPVQALFDDPQHPYTIGLLGSIPRLDEESDAARPSRARCPAGLAALPPGCRFAPRCPFADATCRAEAPPLRAAGAGPCRRLLEGAGRTARAPTRPWRMSDCAEGGCRRPAPLLKVRGLVKHFPVQRGVILSRVRGPGARGRRCQLRHRARRDAGAGRRIRLRQVAPPAAWCCG
jgi:oligopeptide/dipeptide ABC transporter ATP-binding protein